MDSWLFAERENATARANTLFMGLTGILHPFSKDFLHTWTLRPDNLSVEQRARIHQSYMQYILRSHNYPSRLPTMHTTIGQLRRYMRDLWGLHVYIHDHQMAKNIDALPIRWTQQQGTYSEILKILCETLNVIPTMDEDGSMVLVKNSNGQVLIPNKKALVMCSPAEMNTESTQILVFPDPQQEIGFPNIELKGNWNTPIDLTCPGHRYMHYYSRQQETVVSQRAKSSDPQFPSRTMTLRSWNPSNPILERIDLQHGSTWELPNHHIQTSLYEHDSKWHLVIVSSAFEDIPWNSTSSQKDHELYSLGLSTRVIASNKKGEPMSHMLGSTTFQQRSICMTCIFTEKPIVATLKAYTQLRHEEQQFSFENRTTTR